MSNWLRSDALSAVLTGWSGAGGGTGLGGASSWSLGVPAALLGSSPVGCSPLGRPNCSLEGGGTMLGCSVGGGDTGAGSAAGGGVGAVGLAIKGLAAMGSDSIELAALGF